MATVAECIEKMVAAGQVGRQVADEALEFFRRSKAEFSMETGPASADAAAALETAKKMNNKAAEQQVAIAADVKRWQTIEKRIVEDPRGRNAALSGVLSKDTLIGDNRLRDLLKAEPEHPIFADGNVDTRTKLIGRKLFSMMGPDLDRFKTGFFSDQQLITSSRNFVHELFGDATGDKLSKVVADAFTKTTQYAAQRAKQAGKIFNELEDWRLPQSWTSSRVGQFTPNEFVKDFSSEISNGGLKLFDEDTGRYAAATRTDAILRKAYSDIKTGSGPAGPFGKEMRTFQFQPGQKGADAWLKLQGKYGVGNEIMSTVTSHLDAMARTIALHETFGGHPDAVFAAALRLVKDDQTAPVKGAGFLTSPRMLKLTYDTAAGRGNPVGNETAARIMAGARDALSMASLRNLPITIIPGDSAMTMLASQHLGMDGFKVLGEVLNSGLTKDEARHLEISAHGYMDFINNSVRKYEDQLNVSGLIRKVARTEVKLTGAEWWTTNGRQGWQASMLNQLESMRNLSFDKLPENTSRNLLARYGITPKDWDVVRKAQPFVAHNGARYIDPTALPQAIQERLMGAIHEQGAYAFHQPDARTQAFMRQGTASGTIPGELMASVAQFKQFTMERMTTHLMRVLTDGPLSNRVARGAAFTILSMAAGAVSMQAGALATGKDPLDMTKANFWAKAFARGGAGGIYGDILNAALEGDRGGLNMAAQLAGPLPGFAGDIAEMAAAPLKQELDPTGRKTPGELFASQAFGFGKRWTPTTWYTKLAVDRLIWDKLQMLADPDYRKSFQRAEKRAKQQGSDFWFKPGESAPERAPNMATAIGG